MIIALSGPSGIGKDYIKKRLLITFPFLEELVWFTTRQLRPNEVRSNRTFVTIPEFSKLADAGELVLVKDFYGYRYGLSRTCLLPSSHVRLTELHPENVIEALKINPTIVVIGLITFDLSLLRERLSIVRNTENALEIEKRVTAAKTEIKTILLNKRLFVAVIEVSKISEASIFKQVLTTLSPYLN